MPLRLPPPLLRPTAPRNLRAHDVRALRPSLPEQFGIWLPGRERPSGTRLGTGDRVREGGRSRPGCCAVLAIQRGKERCAIVLTESVRLI